MRAARRLAVLGLVSCACLAGAQTSSQFVDPFTLLEKVDESVARRGWLPLWNLESERDWLGRLRQSPPKVVAVFLRWSPTAPRISDFDLLLCLNRPLQEPERGLLTYWVQAKVEFLDGASDSVEMRSGPLSSFGRERCISIPEQHLLLHARSAWRDFSARTELRYRPDKIKSVSATVSREQEVASQTETFTPSFHIYPARRGKDGDVKPTRDFIAGRVKGEALRSARRCKNIVTVEEISRPAENDRSDYAQGFELGWRLAGSFLNSDQRCDELPAVFGIEQVGITAAIRAVSKCVQSLGQSLPNLALTADHACLRPSE
jgi:hypothetical protein